MTKKPAKDLTTVKNTTSYLFKEWLTNDKVGKFYKSVGLDETKAAILSDIEKISPKGKESYAYQLNVEKFSTCKSITSLMMYLSNSMFGGAGMKV